VNIKFCVKLGKTPTQTYEMLQIVCGDEALSHGSLFEWFKQFKDGHEDIQDDPRNGSPSTSRNADTISNVYEMVIRDHLWPLRMMVDELNINKEAIHQKIHEDLWKRKICTNFIPQRLTDEQKQQTHITPRPHPDLPRQSQLHFRFLKVKTAFKGKRFQDAKDN
jgi:hypothetical protein